MKTRSYVWHPNTQMSEWSKFPKIVRGEGMWLIDEDGNRFLDGVASMWCNVWGHSKKELINAIIKQTNFTRLTFIPASRAVASFDPTA